MRDSDINEEKRKSDPKLPAVKVGDQFTHANFAYIVTKVNSDSIFAKRKVGGIRGVFDHRYIQQQLVEYVSNSNKRAAALKAFSTFVVEQKDPNEYDQEGEMAENQLRTIIDAAEDLIDLLEDDDNLPEWAQNKITKAVDYLDSVRDYMLSDAAGEEDDDEEDDLDEAFSAAFDK
jgi:hypothetical protein